MVGISNPLPWFAYAKLDKNSGWARPPHPLMILLLVIQITQYNLKLIISNSTILFRTGFHCHQFLQVMSHFRGFEPQLRRYFFLKSDIKWTFLHFNVLKSYVISLKTQKFVKEISKIAIAIYLCSIMYKYSINS